MDGDEVKAWEETWMIAPTSAIYDDDGHEIVTASFNIRSDAGHVVGRLSGDSGEDRSHGDERTRLAAAAPELYRALERLADLATLQIRGESVPNLCDGISDAVEQAIAALLKARG